ncbi:terminase small subunit [Viridibacillus arvi]|uniref:terminase small subunit n=1 Tax=Viridibacillus arvi TaxID=263475 RepID=UPI00187B2656|nr:terminase small subunit [Viridibacillus sp. JNUCC-6]QOV10927.1 terminase small subunit [Viridibacillus sp. JNUCC-6]
MIEKKLNPKQRAFADYYIELGNAEEAALKAGYSKAYARGKAYTLLANVGIKTYIEQRMEELKSERIADQTEVLQYLTSVMRGEIEDEQLLVVGDGDFGSSVEKHNKVADTSNRTKAAELLGKRYALWTDKQQTEVTGAVQFVDDIGDRNET